MILVAFVLYGAPTENLIARRIASIVAHYAPAYSRPLHVKSRFDRSAGLASISPVGRSGQWPFWEAASVRAVATGYLPFGDPILVPPDLTSPLALNQALDQNPSALELIDPPFSMLSIDTDRCLITATVDLLGYGRLYQMQTATGIALSNKIGVLPLILGVYPELSVNGWQYLSCAGWFMQNSSSIEGAHALDAGQKIELNYRHKCDIVIRQAHSYRILLASSSQQIYNIDAAYGVRDHLRYCFDRTYHMSRRPVKINLSGGRDSRMVAAGAIYSEIPARFVTHDLLAGEVETVERLKSCLPFDIDHKVVKAPKLLEPDGSSLEERVIAALRHHDAMGSPNLGVLPTMPGYMASLRRVRSMTGAGGEIGHGHYYPDPGSAAEQPWEATIGKPESIFHLAADHLLRRVGVHGGASTNAKNLVLECIRGWIREGMSLGIQGLNLLDFFYLVERLRRWNGDGKDASFIAPLVCVPYIRAAFSLTPRERRDVVLPRDVVRVTVPEWAGVPYYAPNVADRKGNAAARLWNGPDREAVTDIIMHEDCWGSVFHLDVVRKMWLECVAGGGRLTHDPVFRRVIWYVFFGKYLKELRSAVVG